MEDQFGNKGIFIPCNCGVEVLGITRSIKDKYWVLTYYVDNFYSLQYNSLRNFTHRINLAWKILCGKEYSLFEIIIRDKNMQEFVDFVKENM